jgi:hypothetical protein
MYVFRSHPLLNAMPFGIEKLSEARVSCQRIDRFLQLPELSSARYAAPSNL